jgi:Zn-finger nucleic acid-binding protein
MICPACGNRLTEMEAGDVKVDVCAGGCGGTWFDNFELEKMDEPHESAGEALLDVPRDQTVRVDHEQRRSCPHCDDMVMMRHFVSVKMEVVVDECPACGGHWVDFGELAKIRGQFSSEADREAAAHAYFDEVSGWKRQQMQSASQEKTAKARRIAGMFKFICPSYYIPGKQKWGAF